MSYAVEFHSSNLHLFFVALALVFVIIGFVDTSHAQSIEIIEPKDSATVQWHYLVKGIYSNLTGFIYVLVRPEGAALWEKYQSDFENGHFESHAEIGEPMATGQFKVAAIISEWIPEAQIRIPDPLPSNIRAMSRIITVRR